MTSPTEWERLGVRVEERKKELRDTWAGISQRGNIPLETLRRARHGTAPLTTENRTKLERGLKWKPGSIHAILDGGDPTPEESESDRWEATEAEIAGRWVHIVRDLRAGASGLPPEEAEEVVRRAIERAMGAAESTALNSVEADRRRLSRGDDAE